MNIQEFTDITTQIYFELPEYVRDKIEIQIQEEQPEDFYGQVNYGFYIPILNAIVICYWAFAMNNMLNEEHIRNVVFHEVQHFVENNAGEKLAKQEREGQLRKGIDKEPFADKWDVLDSILPAVFYVVFVLSIGIAALRLQSEVEKEGKIEFFYEQLRDEQNRIRSSLGSE